MAKGLQELNFLMELTRGIYIPLVSNEISSSEDEFDVTLPKEEIISIHREIDDRENTSSDDYSDKVRGVRRRKIKIIGNESDSDSDTAEDPQSDSFEWISCTKSEEIPSRISFIAGNGPAGPHILPDEKTVGFSQTVFLLMNL
ncbi:hypothetical protein M0802_009579 [Mischocyttarus mexicanus]|nr:hypothetical protein M0802_009579 [Mischocyttarus mexicanus]